MAELVNLRVERKRAKRRDEERRATSNRLAHGQAKSKQKLAAAQQEQSQRDLDRHLIDKGGDR